MGMTVPETDYITDDEKNDVGERDYAPFEHSPFAYYAVELFRRGGQSRPAGR